MLRNWYSRIVKHYSKAELTHPRDRFPAILGIAATYGSALIGGRYVSGHWEHRLLESLTWTKPASIRACQAEPTEAYIAPSWSWASTNSEVNTAVLQTISPISTFVNASVEQATSDPWGAVTKGCLHLCGPLRRIDRLWKNLVDYKPSSKWSMDTLMPGMEAWLCSNAIYSYALDEGPSTDTKSNESSTNIADYSMVCLTSASGEVFRVAQGKEQHPVSYIG
ncbi:hypothetical protein PG994_004189 [Apiospora phragmitis]|uniref:Uncharacterized protein n=1 Tax=Apiospora phragmitis TaxID=2905665 RepID=A0ABR1VPW1_9PEZI